MEIDIIIKKYIKCRDSLSAETKIYNQIKNFHKADMAKMEEVLLEEADAQKVKSFKTEFGTAVKTKKDFITVAASDWDEALDFMISNDLKHMISKSVNKEAVKEYMEANGGDTPPGLKYGKTPVISIRRK